MFCSFKSLVLGSSLFALFFLPADFNSVSARGANLRSDANVGPMYAGTDLGTSGIDAGAGVGDFHVGAGMGNDQGYYHDSSWSGPQGGYYTTDHPVGHPVGHPADSWHTADSSWHGNQWAGGNINYANEHPVSPTYSYPPNQPAGNVYYQDNTYPPSGGQYNQHYYDQGGHPNAGAGNFNMR